VYSRVQLRQRVHRDAARQAMIFDFSGLDFSDKVQLATCGAFV
jgi:hypothetical protein